jgi:hypothetical protein
VCREVGRDLGELHIAVALEAAQPEDLPALSDAGVSELVLVEAPPENPDEVEVWIAALARRWRAATS